MSELLPIIDGREWEHFVTRNMPFWHVYSYVTGMYQHTADFGITTPSSMLVLTVGGTHSNFFFEKESLVGYENNVAEIINSEAKVRSLKYTYLKLAENILSCLERCTNEVSAENWRELIAALTPFYAGLNVTVIVGRLGSAQLIEALKEYGVAESEIAETVGVITYPSEHTPLFNSSLAMLEIGKKVQTEHPTEQKLEHLLQEWLMYHGYIPVNFCDDPWSLEDAKKQLNAVLSKDCASAKEELEREHRQRIVHAKNRLHELHNSKIHTLAFALQEGTYINEFRKNLISKVSWKAENVFKEVGRRLNHPWRDCFYLTANEIAQVLSNDITDISSILSLRQEVGAYSDKKGTTQFLNGEEISHIKTYIQSPVEKDSHNEPSAGSSVRGFSANKGKVQGTAKIIMAAADFPKFHRGDILIAPMTSVDFVPIMELAAAFVTNEGGITSHASIVAREMNKPCVIGTKNATKVFKDGDLVEVNGDTGEVSLVK